MSSHSESGSCSSCSGSSSDDEEKIPSEEKELVTDFVSSLFNENETVKETKKKGKAAAFNKEKPKKKSYY